MSKTEGITDMLEVLCLMADDLPAFRTGECWNVNLATLVLSAAGIGAQQLNDIFAIFSRSFFKSG